MTDPTCVRAARKTYRAARLYAAPLMLIVWAALIGLLADLAQLMTVRLVSVAVALALSIHELNAKRND